MATNLTRDYGIFIHILETNKLYFSGSPSYRILIRYQKIGWREGSRIEEEMKRTVMTYRLHCLYKVISFLALTSFLSTWFSIPILSFFFYSSLNSLLFSSFFIPFLFYFKDNYSFCPHYIYSLLYYFLLPFCFFQIF